MGLRRRRRSGSTDDTAARVIGVSTAVSGAGMLLAPVPALKAMGANEAPPAPLLYRLIGMFMVVCGGLLVQGSSNPLVLRWSLVQKAGAVAVQGLGVASGDYRRRALGMAAFDAVCALLLARALRRRSS